MALNLDGLTPKFLLVWRFLQQSGCRVCQWSVRKLHLALGISRSTVEKALKALNALGVIRTRPGTYNRASEHEILQTFTVSTDAPAPEIRDASVPESRDTNAGNGQNRDTLPGKSGHPAAGFCMACAHRLGLVSRATLTVNSERREEVEAKQKLAYVPRPVGNPEKLAALAEGVRASFFNLHLTELKGVRFDDSVTAACIAHPLYRLGDEDEIKDVVLRVLEPKICAVRDGHFNAQGWQLFAHVVKAEVDRRLGYAAKRPAARAASASGGEEEQRSYSGSKDPVAEAAKYKAMGAFA